MKKYLLCFSFPILLAFTFCSQNTVNVNIEVIADNLPEGSKIYITGNDDQLGNWQPDSIELSEIEKGKWSKSFSFIKGKKLEFKITRGSWDTEALGNHGAVPDNYVVEILNDTTIEINITLWADQVERKIEGQITGTVQYHKSFQGEGIKPRDVIVWLPPDYESDLNNNYPVLYMHDGQNIVDPATSAFQVDWQIDEAADSLIRKELIEPIIIVGIYNTSDRNDEYADGELGFSYMKFIVDSLKPFIDSNYRTKPDRMNTANGGGSLGGLISFLLMWEYSETFSKSISFSPAFKIDNYDCIDNVKSYEGKLKQFQLYINNGDNELDSSLQPGIDEMLIVLKQKDYIEGDHFYFHKGKNSLHSERGWAKNIWRALIFIFGTEKGKSLL
ncbi:MAG TPA: alpha/beta hydrolase-fold protein [Ignavibacteriaceae bacterium]|nr:alpha/beta hydrolase-fold protein [Ignavibacteriaceae bacterium]